MKGGNKIKKETIDCLCNISCRYFNASVLFTTWRELKRKYNLKLTKYLINENPDCNSMRFPTYPCWRHVHRFDGASHNPPQSSSPQRSTPCGPPPPQRGWPCGGRPLGAPTSATFCAKATRPQFITWLDPMKPTSLTLVVKNKWEVQHSAYECGDLGVHKGEPSVLAEGRHAAFCVDRLKSPHIIVAERIFSEVTYADHYSLFMFPALCALSCGAVANIGLCQYQRIILQTKGTFGYYYIKTLIFSFFSYGTSKAIK